MRAYGLNLLGSLGGVLLMYMLSVQWTPPAIWFGTCFAALLLFQAFDRRALLLGACVGLVGLTALTWPAMFPWEQVYSPYQLIERGPGARGLTTIRAAGIRARARTNTDLQPRYRHDCAFPARNELRLAKSENASAAKRSGMSRALAQESLG